MRETTTEQNVAAEFVSGYYGSCAVLPTRLNYATGTIILIGLTDDIERDAWVVRPDGHVSAYRPPLSRALEAYLEAIGKHPSTVAVRDADDSIWEKGS